MPASRRAPPSRTFDLAAWLPSPKVLLWMLLAFVAGVLLFGVVWLADRRGGGEATPTVAPAASSGDGYQPLPTPVPARGERRIERPSARATPGGPPQPQLVESTAPPPPSASPAGPAQQRAPAMAAGAYVSPQPIPGQTPSPDYPARALRRGESGTVTLRAEIGPDGVPIAVEVERSSGSRALDRAAEEAVRRWRFQPALRDGQPATGSVVVPITFNPG